MASIITKIKLGLSAVSRITARSVVIDTKKQFSVCGCEQIIKPGQLSGRHPNVGTLLKLAPGFSVRGYSSKTPDEQSYEPYQEFETPSPYKRRQPIRYGYDPKYFKGGVLPRPKGEYEDRPVKGTKRLFPQDRDAWTQKKALFGQNDYIDILGDGSVHPWKLISAPPYVKAFKGPELETLIRRMLYQGRQMKYLNPTKYNQIQKRIFYLYKKRNNYRKSKMFWGGRRAANRGRLHSPRGAHDQYILPMKIKGC